MSAKDTPVGDVNSFNGGVFKDILLQEKLLVFKSSGEVIIKKN